MTITLNNIGKCYHLDWIFRNVTFEFKTGEPCAIQGPNGSGKSTLLQIISGMVVSSEGTITYSINNKIISIEDIFRHLSIATPYLDLIEDFTLAEIINFHFQFKKILDGVTKPDLIEIIGLKKAKDKQLKYYSSGMKQRVKLALAIFSDTQILLLDEPTSNLDKTGIDWYRTQIEQHISNRLILVCSNNQSQEFDFCKHEIDIMDYRKK
jgi:ABC-type multidrug transport system ATPase subunit